MIGLVQEIVVKQTFFLDRYFPTGTGDIFKSDKVLVEYTDGDRRMAPFVVRRAGDIPIARGGYEIHEYEPPYIAPSRLLTLDDLERRGFGEAIFSNTTPQQRSVRLLMGDIGTLDGRIGRREEWMAAQTMINNGCEAVEYIDNETVGDTWDVFYYDIGKSNPALYTVANKWGQTGGDMWGDVQEMCGLLSDRGLPVADLVVGTDVGSVIEHDDKAAKRLDNRRMEYGSIQPDVRYPGVVWLGHLNFGGFDLDIYVVRETYTDQGGKSRRLFPAKSAMVTAPGCGHMMYGQVTQMERDEQYHTYAGKRIPKNMSDYGHDMRKLRLASRPLAAPKALAPWIYAADVVD
jgi:hypothetical protein